MRLPLPSLFCGVLLTGLLVLGPRVIAADGATVASSPPATAGLPPLPAPLGVPAPAPATDAPYAPQPILPGGVVVPLFAPDSAYL